MDTADGSNEKFNREVKHERHIEEDSPAWSALNGWSSNTPADITIDGVKMNVLFGRIKSQLDFLRGKVGLLIAANNDRKEEEKINKLIADVAKLEALCADQSKEQKKLESELKRQEMEVKQQETKYAEFLTYAESKFTYYRQTISALDDQIAKLKDRESMNQRRILDIELQAAQNFQELKSIVQSNEKKTAASIQGLHDVIEGMRSGVVEAQLSVERMEAQVMNAYDVVSVNDLRVNELSKKFATSNANMEEMRVELEELPHKHIEPLARTVTELVATKADRTELAEKADISMTTVKADIQEIARLDEIIKEMERMVIDHKREVSEEMVSYDMKLERKGDRITQYCVQEMRRLLTKLQQLQQPKEQPSNTDIGKVRCLVCDQVTQQNTEAQGTIFGGPPIRGVFKELNYYDPPESPVNRERPRSPGSPSNPSPRNIIEEAPQQGRARSTNLLPRVVNGNHSKLVHLGATPMGGSSPPVPMEVFTRSAVHHELTAADFQSQQQTHSRDQILPVHLQGTERIMSDENPLLPSSQKQNYFKDLEEYVYVSFSNNSFNDFDLFFHCFADASRMAERGANWVPVAAPELFLRGLALPQVSRDMAKD